MMNRNFTFSEIGLFAATRVALGIGIGLLISRRLGRNESKAAGLALTALGGLTTIPFVVGAIARRKGEVAEIGTAA